MTPVEVPARFEEKAELAELVRAYVNEMERIIGLPRSDGTYPYFGLYWTEPETRWPFWLKVDRANAGFALVQRNAETKRTEMEEFFVAPEFRKRGIGLAAARSLIARFPGAWRITQREQNSGAIAFWHRVLDGFVAYDETTTRTDAVRRQQQFRFP